MPLTLEMNSYQKLKDKNAKLQSEIDTMQFIIARGTDQQKIELKMRCTFIADKGDAFLYGGRKET